ncbi:MAG TPA: heme peroxidase family protein [Solirubrobacteraceae bacterium]|jgi:hypothetical protein|nr:heme peroxidase family protein [Solirubrobacteraceae bacterium]
MLDLKHGAAFRPDKKQAAPKETPFDYLLPALKSQPGSTIPGDPAKVTADLTALGAAMIDNGPAAATDAAGKVNSNIPTIYTYWGQFIDHDMTANTDRDGSVSDITKTPVVPVPPSTVAAKLKNLRRPTFDLDNVYGNGPGLRRGNGQGAGLLEELLDRLLDDDKPDPGPADKGLYDGVKLRVGTLTDGAPGVKIPPEADMARDLPRIGPLLAQGAITEADIPESLRTDVNRDTRAFIGDGRNDENLLVAQFHLLFLRFHNNVVDAIAAKPESFGLPKKASDIARFETARRLVQWHYQWLVINDYLPTVTLPGVLDKVLVGGNKFYKPLAGGVSFAPLEYSVAAFRFGHTMVRGGYDHNRNFGRPEPGQTPTAPFASFNDLFRFTGNGFVLDPNDITKSTRNPMRGAPTLPVNWPVEYARMARKFDANEGHMARKIDTRLVPPILNMVNEGTDASIQDGGHTALRQLLRSLSTRNLLRGYLLSIPTGQAVADAMGVSKLSEAELQQGNTDAVNAALTSGGFLQNTPLWYYVLKEAEIRAAGNSLGELGSRIVVETQVGIMRNDPKSYLNAKGGWNPSKGVKLANGDPIVTIRDFIEFAGLPA